MKAWVWVGGVAVLAIWGCAEAEMPDWVDGAQVYNDNCASCHGASAKGDGVLAAGLSAKPSDLTLITSRNNGFFPVSAVLSKIDGYSADKNARAAMPEFGEMLQGALVPVETEGGVMTPTPRPLAALMAYLQSIQD